MTSRFVFSSNYLLNYLYKQSLKQQLEIFGTGKRNEIINLNYYYLFIDTILRMLANFDRIYKKTRKSKTDKITIVIDDWTYPKLRRLPTGYSPYPCNQEFLHKLAISKLYHLNNYITDDDVDFFETIELLLAKSYPQHFRFKVGVKSIHSSDLVKKAEYERELFYFLGLIQSQLTHNSLKKIYEIVLSLIQNLAGVIIVEYKGAFNRGYEAAEVAAMNTSEQTMLFAKYVIKADHIDVCDFVKIKPSKQRYNAIKYGALIVSDVKQKKFNTIRFKTLFQFCKDEMTILVDINNINTFNIFTNVKRLYDKNKLTKSYFVSKYDVDPEMELEELAYVDVIVKLIDDFNKIYKYKIKY